MILSTIAGTPQLNLTSRHVGITGLCRTKAQTSASLLEILSDTKGESLTKSHQRDWIHEIKWQVSITMVVWVFWAFFFCYRIQITSRRKEHTTDDQTFLSSPFQTCFCSFRPSDFVMRESRFLSKYKWTAASRILLIYFPFEKWPYESLAAKQYNNRNYN